MGLLFDIRKPLRTSLATLFAGVFLFTFTARAEDINDALTLEYGGRLLEALEVFQQLLHEGGQSQANLATIYLHSALIQQASGDYEGARASMTALLAVDTDPVLPETAPPEVAELLEEAIRVWSGRQLRAEARPLNRAEGDEIITLRIDIIDDVPNLVSRVAVISGEDPIIDVPREPGENEIDVTIDPSSWERLGESLELEIWLLDQRENILWQGGVSGLNNDSEWQSETSGRSATRRAERRRPLWIAGWATLAVGLASVCAGSVLVGIDGTLTGNEQITSLGREVERLNTAAGGWVLVGFGSAFLATSVILLVLSSRSRTSEDAISRVVQGRLLVF